MTRRAQILTAAYEIAVAKGIGQLTRLEVAKELGVTAPLINHHFKNMADLREAVIKRAFLEENMDVIVEALDKSIITGADLETSAREKVFNYWLKKAQKEARARITARLAVRPAEC